MAVTDVAECVVLFVTARPLCLDISRGMDEMKRSGLCWIFGILTVVMLSSGQMYAQEKNVIAGVNASMGSQSIDQQNTILAELHAAGVHFIRTGITPDDKGVDFARRAQAQGIRILWLVQLQYRPGAPSRPWPNAFNVWGGPPLSAVDPDQFRKYFQSLLAKLEVAGVTLAGFELGNEINSPIFNADFSMPAENPSRSREFNLDDLSHDPEAAGGQRLSAISQVVGGHQGRSLPIKTQPACGDRQCRPGVQRSSGGSPHITAGCGQRIRGTRLHARSRSG
jgi:hypothetical protein